MYLSTSTVGPDVYANNRLSLTLVDSPAADLLWLMTGMIHDAAISLPKAILDPDFGPSDDPAKSSFMYYHKDEGIDGTLFDYFDANVGIYYMTIS